MKLIEGTSLAEELRAKTPRSPRNAKKSALGAQLLAASGIQAKGEVVVWDGAPWESKQDK